jgi:uncharacterized protein (TIGR03067 family)
MRRLILTMTWLALSAIVAAAAPALKDRKNEDRDRIVGVWVQESITVHGNASDSPQHRTFRFGKDGTCGITNGTGSENPARYTLDPSTSPRRMKWLNGPEMSEWQCLYELDGDSLKVAFVDQGTEAPNKIEPTRNLTIYYLKRVKE